MTDTPQSAVLTRATDNVEWWRGAVIYQIYPRSFQDSNGDGVGDLRGITERLPYIAELGVDGIWISPFFTSPMRDFGYDVADYCDVDPIFGSLDDFDTLMTKAHALGLKVIIDQVFAHTSDEHDWFADSRTSRTSEKSDWYVWADAKPDGSPPNNWQSVFGGPAWTWDARRQQYYMHNFLSSQPQLNAHNHAVQDALIASANFWLERGVDGFRLDAINFSMHNQDLTDNPAWPREGRVITRPFDLQHKVHNQSQPEIVDFIERIRSNLDKFGEIFTVAEVGGPTPLAEMKAFTQGTNRLSSAYSFDFLYAEDFTVARIVEASKKWTHATDEGWPSWAFSNHDAPRFVSRWSDNTQSDDYTKLVLAILLSLRGNPIIYQGEELGLPQADIPFDKIQDPEALTNWPLTLGRDGARTPMPWDASAANAGFSSGDPWLPICAEHQHRSVAQQAEMPASILNFTRNFLHQRRTLPALRYGAMTLRPTNQDVLLIERSYGPQTLLAAFNLSRESQPLPTSLDRYPHLILSQNTRGGIMSENGFVLKASEV